MGKLQFHEKLQSIAPYKVDKTLYPIKLDANESFITFSESLKEELAESIKNVAFNRYPDPDATEVCELYSKYCGCDIDNIIAGNGSDELIQVIVNAFMGKADKALTLKPDFSMYKFYSSLIGANIVEFELDENMNFNVEEFVRKANTEKVKLIIFSNPNNPSGGVISQEKINFILEQTEALVVVDEAYYEFYGESSIKFINKYGNLAVLRTCSKAMGIAATRLGFLISNKNVIDNIKKVKPPFNVNSLTQALGAVILKKTELINRNIESILIERRYLVENLKKCFRGNAVIYPTNANFIYIKCDNFEFIYKQLLTKGISIRYFKDGAIRITVGNREENKRIILELKFLL